MSWQSLVLWVWPPPRRSLTWAGYAPLVLFLVLFPLACFFCEVADQVVFTSLWPFWLLLVAPWVWRMHVGGYSGLSGARGHIALASRFCMIALFVLLFAEPRVVRKDEHLAVMYVVDHSDSIVSAATDGALEYVLKTVYDKPERDEAGLMFFGRNAAVEMPPALSLPYEFEAINVHIDRDGTDIAKALSLAAAMLPPETQSRIVLISDGVETQGGLAGVIDDLDARGIPVDILPVDYQFEKEVWLERLDLPRSVKIGQPFEASVVLSSLHNGRGTLTLEQNGQVIGQQQVSFHSGKNRFSMPVKLTQTGYYEYSARIEAPKGEDSWADNNTAISFMYLQGRGRILLVTDGVGEEKDWTALRQALLEGEREVDVIAGLNLKSNPMALLPYDCIVFVNVPRDKFSDAQMQAVHDAVYNQGSGFVMIGGPNSFGPGGYNNTVIEKLLPVDMDVTKRKVMPKGALVIVLHTCEFADGNTWGKRITKKAIEVLNPRDDVGVLVYDYSGGYEWLFELCAAENYPSLAVQINNAQIGDMPDFQTTMQMGLNGLKTSDASAKHMIIISDGDPSPPTTALLGQFSAAQVRISTVAINPHHNQQVTTLQLIAKATGGRFYFPKDPSKLPEIFIKEAKTLRRSAIQEKTFVPMVTAPSPILKGLSRLPPLHGYVWTTPKPRSTVILDGPEEEDPDPVLAHMRYGVGAAAAFTGDLSPRWGKDWMSWSQYSAFVRQLVTEVSRAGTEATAQVRTFASGETGHVVVEDFSKAPGFLNVGVQVDGPGGAPRRMTLRQVGPGRYEGSFPLTGKGRYQVTAVGVGGDGSEKLRAFGGFVVSYSSEYLRFRADNVALDRIRARTGGRRLAGTETGKDLFGIERAPRLSSKSIVDLLLLLLACLIPLDVALRRVQLDWSVIRGWFGGSKESTETLSTLLKLKQQRRKEADAEPDPGVERPVTRTITAADKDAPAADTPGQAPSRTPHTITSDEKAPSGTTTSRLLEAKRRAQKKKQ